MKYSGIIYNDFSAAPGVALSFFAQGCPHHCPGCHNPETWDYDGGQAFTYEVVDKVIEGLTANGIHRSLCIMGGEPLCSENEFLTHLLVSSVKERLPNTPIYIWTGYLYEDLLKRGGRINQIFELTDYLIDGPYVEAKRDVTLALRGSSNQRIIKLHSIDKK